MNYFLKRAIELEEETIQNRRYIHENAEVGLDLPKTVDFVVKKLQQYGYKDIAVLGGGVVATVGQGDKTILLRADMDALAQEEITGLPYACTAGACHSCGHDTHTAMLLTAAKMLKEKESELKGVVKLMFQPGEEGWGGAKIMIDAGLLENPRVDAALGIHNCSFFNAGEVHYSKGRSRSAITFRILVHGKTTHGAGPHRGISALSAAAAIVSAAERLPAMEVFSEESAVLSFGKLISGVENNVIPNLAELEGTIRVFDNGVGSFLTNRLEEVARNVAAAYRCTAEMETSIIPSFENSAELCDEVYHYLEDICGEEKVVFDPGDFPGTDDFSFVGLAVPSMYYLVGTTRDEGSVSRGGHDPAAVIKEDGMKYGAACYANAAYRWLENHAGK